MFKDSNELNICFKKNKTFNFFIQQKIKVNDWNLLLSGWSMEVLDFYRIWHLIIQ